VHKFIDETPIFIKAGKGGPGAISFLHEKFMEFGGPDGGDGGAGGDIYIVPDARIIALSHIRKERIYTAQNGRHGEGTNSSGKKGRDLTIRVPYGTQILHPETGEVIHDFLDDEPFVAAKGGRGGKGNHFFRTSRKQTPRFAQPGEETEVIEFKLALKMIADVGLVGFPNAGKSTLLKALTHANPRIASYPFTTLSPNIGVLESDDFRPVMVADIPGILEGASKGYGLGLSFLKHIERVKIIVFVLDMENSLVEHELKVLRSELETYNSELLERPSIIVFNKTDLVPDKKFLKDWLKSFKKESITPIPVSALKEEGLDELRKAIFKALKIKKTRKKSK
jgi:GTP-binding protein